MINEIMAPQGWIALLLLWVLYFWLYREYRLDLFRQRMFALRDELFDLADGGTLPFDSKAYGMLRSVINGNIQFGHQLGFLELLFYCAAGRRAKSKYSNASRFEEVWSNACSSLSSDAVKELQMIRMRMHVLVFEQLIFTSFTLMVTMVALVVAVLTLFAKKAVSKLLEHAIRKMELASFLTQLECFASSSRLKAT